MSTWALIQIVFDIFAALGLFIIVMRMNRQPKDDPRLSRGLQLLTSKIAVLEDLSDRTETQVSQLVAMLEQKAREVQAKVQLAEQHVHAIRVSMDRSLEVAKIFQDKIPHQEIIERQNTIKYVHAARLAHQGLGIDEIARQVDLPKGEIEFITKVNRDRLMFSEDELPDWARESQAPTVEKAPEMHREERSQSFARDTDQRGSLRGVSAEDGFTMMEPPTYESESKHSSHSDHPQQMSYSSSSLSHLSFAENVERRNHDQQFAPETASTVEIEQDATRLRAEMELAERQLLVENLSRLQTEMQALDKELAREASMRDLSGAFEAPKVETASLQRLGEEFRKACEQAQQMSEKSSIFPPLEHLSSLLQPAFETLSRPAEIILPSIPAAVAAAFQSRTEQAQVNAAAVAHSAMPSAAGESHFAREESAQDLALRRAAAQAKVQAALRAGEARTPAVNSEIPAELAAAREMAKQAAAVAAPLHMQIHTQTPQPQAQAQQRPQQQQPQAQPRALARKSSVIQPGEIAAQNGPVIKKVVFPKLEGPN